MRCEPDQPGALAESLSYELTEVQLTDRPHIRRTSISQVRVVSPDDGARGSGRLPDVGEQRLKGLLHVRVTEIPRVGAAAEHRPVILLCIRDQARILFREEVVVGGNPAVARGVFGG